MLTYYKPTIALFVGRSANPKVCARKKHFCEPEHLCIETHKKSNRRKYVFVRCY